MTTLFIPTRNRPKSLAAVLGYLARFYPGTSVLIADGSEFRYADAYREAVKSVDGVLNIEYRVYDYTVPMGERIIDAVSRLEDELIIVGADDDYPMLEVLLGQERLLLSDTRYVLAIGGIVGLRFDAVGGIQAKLLHARGVEKSSPVDRVREFIRWPYATSYSLMRRRYYLHRCTHAEHGGFPGFGDYTIGFHDCLAGKIKAIPDICYITTTNPTQSKMRRRSNLFYLERASEVLALKEHYRDTLMKLDGMTESRAESLAVLLINTRVAEIATPAIQNRPGFGQSPFFADPVVRKQYETFQAMFWAGTPERRRFEAKLRYVADAVTEVARLKTDNVGEPAIYDSLSAMHVARPDMGG